MNIRHLVLRELFGWEVPLGEQAAPAALLTQATWDVHLSCTWVAGRTTTFVRPLHRPKHRALTGRAQRGCSTRNR
jgi:hypothetical protein